MNPVLEAKLSNLPENPGIYQFLNDKKKVIYVGKAKNLKNRVRSYFHSSITSPKTLALVSKIEDIEMIITGNEIEALVLENNLIKELKPRYNINLKDDKTYPFIRITNEPFPRIFPTRKIIRDGSKYFGPYTDVKNMKSALRMINQIFKIRSCSLILNSENIEKKKFKVCLDFHIKKCDGPCEGLVSREEYAEMVDEVTKLLRGKTDDLITALNQKMEYHVKSLEFEKAAVTRDKLNQLSAISSKQKVVSADNSDKDIIAAAKEDKDVAGSILIIRGGKLVAKKQIRLSVEMDDNMAEIYSSVIKFFYGEFTEVPGEIVVEEKPAEEETIKEWLEMKAGRKVRITVPQKESDVKSLTKMCKENAILQLKDLQLQRMKKEGNVPYVLTALKRDLRLNVLPRTIECFDNSNLQGSDPVASMVVFVDGKPKKSLYRKFIIKEVVGPDDFASMREIIRRRYSRVIEEKLPFPELIMVDGGKGQLSSAVEILEELGVKNYNIIGLAKRLEEVFFPNNSEPESIPKTSSGLKLLQQVRDEAHRFAITFHRERRSKRIITSELNEIKGIGENTVETLLKSLGSLENIKQASLEKISQIVGKKKAAIVMNYFEQNKNENTEDRNN
jgi:excinuclease ABC subunit C